MPFFRIAASLVVLFCFLTSGAWGADNLTYSGVPGKWQRKSKDDKNKAPDAELQERDKKERTFTVTITGEDVRQQKGKKEK